MKFLINYSAASFLFIAVFFFLLFMNIISIIMLRKVSPKEEEIPVDSYCFAGYEIARS